LFEAVNTGRHSGESGDEKNKKGENVKNGNAKKAVFHNGIVKIQQDNTENINVVYYDPIA
jgi:hypothetical protein